MSTKAAASVSDRYMLISVDHHVGPPTQAYRPYLRADLREEFDAWSAHHQCAMFEGIIDLYGRRQWDPAVIDAEFDADGVAASVLIYGNSKPPFDGPICGQSSDLPRTRVEFERRWAGLQAHNRWLVDFCNSSAKGRHRAMLMLLPHDIDSALDEMRWAMKTGVFCGIHMPGVAPNSSVEPLFHSRYDRVWALATEYGWPLVQHVGEGVPQYPMDQPASGPILFAEMHYWSQRTLLHLLLGGVFERFPDLKYVPTESDSWDWAVKMAASADELARINRMVRGPKSDAKLSSMDKIFAKVLFSEVGGAAVGSLSMLPSEYFARNVYWGLSATAVSPEVLAARSVMGVDHIMWGNDYPHPEGSTPQTREQLRWALAGIPVEECRSMLGGVAAEVYGFDTDLLRPIVERIGPSIAEIHTPLDSVANHGASAEHMMFAGGQDRPFEGGAALYASELSAQAS